MITISKSSSEEIKAFNQAEWIASDLAYYGQSTGWIKEGYIFKAEEDGKLIGSIEGNYEEGVLYIEDVIVLKEKRGLGVGKMLVENAQKYAKERGGHKMYLITGKTWEVRKFYESMGFINTGEFKNHFRNVDFVIYEKSI